MQPGRRAQVGHVRAGAAGDGVDAHAVAASAASARGAASRRCRCSSSSPSTRVMPNWRNTARRHRVGAGEVAGVRLGHRRPCVGAARPSRTRSARRAAAAWSAASMQRAAVLEALDVARRSRRRRAGRRSSAAKSANSRSTSLPVGAQCDMAMPRSWAWKIGRPWWPALGDERDALAREVVAERLERVEVGVRPEQVGVADARRSRVEPLLQRLALGADLGEAGGEDHREARPCFSSTASNASTASPTRITARSMSPGTSTIVR